MKLWGPFLLGFFGLFLRAEAGLSYFETYEENRNAFVQKAGAHVLRSWVINEEGLTTDLVLY